MGDITLEATCVKILLNYSSCRSRDFADSKYLLHHAQFTSEVFPDSFKRPYLIKVTSEWCFACIHIEPVWKEAVHELEPLGESAIKKTVCRGTLREDFITPLNSTVKSIHIYSRTHGGKNQIIDWKLM